MSGYLLAIFDVVMCETTLFAAIGFLFLGTSDLAVDLIWIARTLKRRLILRRYRPACAGTLPPPASSGRIAVFIPAWDESAVIGAMLAHACAVWRGDYLIYVGCYPNDPATIAIVRGFDPAHVRLVVGARPGPTSKADCLNQLWEAMRDDEAVGCRVKAVVLHDAEDVVHSAEIGIFDALVERFDLVQLPVVPLIDPKSRWIGAHYADEFAEAHGKDLVVREALGASVPSAGVGCAIARDTLDRLAAVHGAPFDPDSLTEDYELGLKLRNMGGRAAFVRLPAGPGRPAVATRGYFPATIKAAVTQKARWMVGIALAGWERMGWHGSLAERWMRLRDRQSVFAAIVLFAAYVGLLLWGLYLVLGWPMPAVSAPLAVLLLLNSILLVWRIVMRFGFVTRLYGWREGLRSVPRVVVANAIAMLAARRAVWRYLGARRTGTATWDKTAHAFPVGVPAE